MMRCAWILSLGLGLQALVGCSPAYVAQTAQRDPSCEDQCVLDGARDLSLCLQQCGGADFTDRLGCQEDDTREACTGSPPPQPEPSASDSFILGVIGAVADVAQTVSDIHDATSGGDADAGGEEPDAEPAGPAPNERHDPPKREKKSTDDSKHEPAKPSKSREPAKPSKSSKSDKSDDD